MKNLLLVLVIGALFVTPIYSEEIPGSVLEAKKSVFRIVFLPPKERLRKLPVEEFKKALVQEKDVNFLNWWFRKLHTDAVKAGQKEVPVMAHLTVREQKYVLPLGSAFLLGDTQTLCTASHVWGSMFHEIEDAFQAGRDKFKPEDFREALRKQVIDKRIDFILFGPDRNIILNTYDLDDKEAPVVKHIATPSSIAVLYPDLNLPVTRPHLDFLTIRLQKPLNAAPLQFAKLKRVEAGNRISLKEGEKVYALGFPGAFGKEEIRVSACSYSPETMKKVWAKTIGLTEKARADLASVEFVAVEAEGGEAAEQGMSGGAFVNEKGQVLTVLTMIMPVVPIGVKIDDPAFKVTKTFQGPPPWMLPEFKFAQ